MSEQAQTDGIFKAKYDREESALRRLRELGREKIGPGAEKNLTLLGTIYSKGIEATIARSRRFPDRQQEIRELVQEFILYGAKAILLTGAQRGGDFLNNQLRGQWAERVVLSMKLPGVKLLPFGPSGAAMPGEHDHREVIMTFREIHLLEGKRPDILAFAASAWDALLEAERFLASTWPFRRLESADDAIVAKARCGIEVKNSSWHYARRREAGGNPLSITVKQEEVAAIHNWSQRTGLPVLFIQVLFDEVYCMSFRRMEAAIARGFLYSDGDYFLDAQTGEKIYHKFHLADGRHLCGKVVFPDRSEAQVRVLEDGSVVPFIKFEPAQATDEDPRAIDQEIAYR